MSQKHKNEKETSLRRMSWRDVWILGSVLLGILVILLVFSLREQKEGSLAVVTVNGSVYGTYNLSKDQEIEIKNQEGKVTNYLVIKDGKADMIQADCPDQLCVKQKAVSKDKETIVCLPRKVVVEIQSSENLPKLDDVTS